MKKLIASVLTLFAHFLKAIPLLELTRYPTEKSYSNYKFGVFVPLYFCRKNRQKSHPVLLKQEYLKYVRLLYRV